MCHLACVIRETDCVMYTPVLFTVEGHLWPLSKVESRFWCSGAARGSMLVTLPCCLTHFRAYLIQFVVSRC